MTNDELRRLAEAATPGPWVVTGLPAAYVYAQIENEDDNPDDVEVAGVGRFQDALFIAAANPAAVLALLDRIAALEDESAVLRGDRDRLLTNIARLTGLDTEAIPSGVAMDEHLDAWKSASQEPAP